ncbi:homoserine O-acetyltransferase [Methanonatronarchaeum sp. AMET6-2]|uniref:homoserine O-acetyltransferase MetX n=1 Tax=Methanonatronarchaeum sp. AMET6-2 TaxID=2933293 RepID=UPI001229EF74|nr:homoserine O-acetyltransferase [Methanonatronarchaeum sp. AMET6-2]RZN62589.1 MAG: homoserine O-acetyltransferase [Methanonatronarchaeia archaeon]UOY09417.1 homoserine O-acetyltransferase [Methanonatronarchaeum sp. AMET6-2]
MKEGSVGIVETKKHTIDGKIKLESGKKFGPIDITYETYGKLNEEKTNAILICHPLTADAHAAGYHPGDSKPGWWDNMIGPGKAFDTEKYYVICSNVLGGCKGTTGPPSINPETGQPYGTDFPVVTIKDMVKVQKKLTEHLKIDKLLAVAGGSLGGMQTLQWTASYPDKVRFCIPIATTAKSSPQQIAFNEVGRRAIMSDPNWNGGDYYNNQPPKNGLALARMVGHITYLSDESMKKKFGRKLRNKNEFTYDFDINFEVESYLKYKGKTFVERFDANSYLYLTRAVDYFDLTNDKNDLIEVFKNIDTKFLVIAITSDWLYPPYQSKEIVRALEANNIDVSYSELRSSYGHDAFLLEPGQMKHLITSFLGKITVYDVMEETTPRINKDTSIKQASKTMMESNTTHLPVANQNGQLAGIITAWDIAKAVSQDLKELEDVMTEEVVTANPDEPIRSVINKIEKHSISALPVVDKNNKIIGTISSDVISQLITKDTPTPGTTNKKNI